MRELPKWYTFLIGKVYLYVDAKFLAFSGILTIMVHLCGISVRLLSKIQQFFQLSMTKLCLGQERCDLY